MRTNFCIHCCNLLLISLVICLSIHTHAQTTIPYNSYQSLFVPTQSYCNIAQPKAQHQSPATFFYRFYKHFISPVDVNSCNYSPSCSTYGLQTVQNHGLFLGVLDSFDRILRCHPKANYSNYRSSNHSHLLIDFPLQ